MFLFVLILLLVSILKMVCVLSGGREQIGKSHLFILIHSQSGFGLSGKWSYSCSHPPSCPTPHKEKSKGCAFSLHFCINKSHVEDANGFFWGAGLASVRWNLTVTLILIFKLRDRDFLGSLILLQI